MTVKITVAYDLSRLFEKNAKERKRDMKKLLPVGITLVFCILGNSCNFHESLTPVTAEFILPPDSANIYRMTKRFFVVVPGDTALFYGSCQCTVTTNGIITSIIDDSMYFRTITLPCENITLDDTLHKVYRQYYQQSSTFDKINENTIIRFFEQTDSATLQVAYEEKGTTHYIEKNRRMIMPRTVIVGPYGWFDTDTTKVPYNNKWPTSPLVTIPAIASSESITFDGYSVATRVICLTPQPTENPYSINGVDYQNGMFVKSYFVLHGETFEKGELVRVLGSVQVTRSYFTERGIIDQLTVSYIQKSYSDGSVEIIRERIYVARGPEGAKSYSENQYPW